MHVNLNVKAGVTVEGKTRGSGGGRRAGMSVSGRFIKRPLLSTPRRREGESKRVDNAVKHNRPTIQH